MFNMEKVMLRNMSLLMIKINVRWFAFFLTRFRTLVKYFKCLERVNFELQVMYWEKGFVYFKEVDELYINHWLALLEES